jgi:hypothetical protein
MVKISFKARARFMVKVIFRPSARGRVMERFRTRVMIIIRVPDIVRVKIKTRAIQTQQGD